MGDAESCGGEGAERLRVDEEERVAGIDFEGGENVFGGVEDRLVGDVGPEFVGRGAGEDPGVGDARRVVIFVLGVGGCGLFRVG